MRRATGIVQPIGECRPPGAACPCRAWARNPNAVWSIEQEMKRTPGLKVTLPNEAEDGLVDQMIGE